MRAAQKTHAECVHTLIEAGVDVNIRSTCGSTALTLAVESDSLRNLVQEMDTDSLKCVQLLLRAGALTNTGYQFKTLFTQASDAENNTLQVPALLLAAGEHLEMEQIKDVNYNSQGEILLFTPDAVKQTPGDGAEDGVQEVDPELSPRTGSEQEPVPRGRAAPPTGEPHLLPGAQCVAGHGTLGAGLGFLVDQLSV